MLKLRLAAVFKGKRNYAGDCELLIKNAGPIDTPIIDSHAETKEGLMYPCLLRGQYPVCPFGPARRSRRGRAFFSPVTKAARFYCHHI
jgi:hypothetical protein